MKTNELSTVTAILLLTITTAIAQSTPVYKKYLAKELKTARLYRGPLVADFNGDGKKDYAVVLQNRKHGNQLALYVIYSAADTLATQRVFDLSDTLSFSLEIAHKNRKEFRDVKKFYVTNGIITYANEWNYLFEYDTVKKTFFKAAYYQVGP